MPTFTSTGWDNCTGGTASATTIWVDWTTAGTGSSVTEVWGNWTTAVTISGSAGTMIYPYVMPELTPEQIEQQRLQAEHCRLEAEQRERERAEARIRADALLRAWLAPEQLSEYERDGYFHVETERARYRIRRGRSANIDVLNPDGSVSHRLCVHPADAVPDEDTMLAQKLALESDETRVLSIANRHPVRQAA